MAHDNTIISRPDASLARITKQPGERRFFAVDFSRVLAPLEMLTAAACDDLGVGVVSAVTCAGRYATLELANGSHGSMIPLRLIVEGDKDSVCEQDIVLVVIDPAIDIAPALTFPDGMVKTGSGNWYRLDLADDGNGIIQANWTECAAPAYGGLNDGLVKTSTGLWYRLNFTTDDNGIIQTTWTEVDAP